MSRVCQSCLEEIESSIAEAIHPGCYKKLFNAQKVSLRLRYERRDIIEEIRVKSLRMSLEGAQPKASVGIVKGQLEILDRGGQYLLKPSIDTHPFISENEHLCMRLAALAGLPTPPHCLVQLKDGEYAFLIKRFDRVKKNKIHIEDFCSVLNEPTENKFSRSYLEVGNAIIKYCLDSGLDLLTFYRAAMLSYLVGNNDLHLKNFSIIERDDSYELSPMYDIVCAARYYPHAPDLCLELMPNYSGGLASHGFYTCDDFAVLGQNLGLSALQIRYQMQLLIRMKESFFALVEQSFLPTKEKDLISRILRQQFEKFEQGSFLHSSG